MTDDIEVVCSDDKSLDDSAKIEETIQNLFIQEKWTLATAESCTGGAIASKLTKIPGASNYFLGGIIPYSNDLKCRLLGIDKELISTKGAVSRETAEAMLANCLKMTKSTFAISTTGIAGPTGEAMGKPVGLVYISVGKQDGKPYSKAFQMHGSRKMVIEWSVDKALGILLDYCHGLPNNSSK